MAYTFLSRPRTSNPEEKVAVESIPTPPDGSNTELMEEMIPMISLTKKHGFDPEKHWRMSSRPQFSPVPVMLKHVTR